MKSFLHFSKFKKVLLVLLFAELMNLPAFANPGDTTWVTVFNARRLGHYGNFDTTATFPTGKRYRKIRLHYIIGRYSCPVGTQYCGSWDYTTKVRVMPPAAKGQDSVEIARVITPYATDWLNPAKKHEYIMDVTDYASVLDGINGFRFIYEGYSWGFTLTLKFEFIEGIPPMDALSVKNVYDGYFCYGASPSSTNTNCYIENNLSPKTFISYIAPVANVYLKNTVSGHGADGANCAEFCSKYYNLKIDGNQVSQVQLWKPNCGWNEEYGQTGTWIYDRANWCPGEIVYPIFHNLTPLITTNATYNIDVDMQPYTINNPSAGYSWASQLISYTALNYTVDAAIEDVISPTNADDYRRENPNCTNPVIKLKNTGTTPITSVVFNYGLRGQIPLTHTWTSSGLGSLRDTLVVFPSASAILSGTVSSYFDFSIVSVNGAVDNNQYNNVWTSLSPSVTPLREEFIVRQTSNGVTGETTWSIYDDVNNVIFSGAEGDTYVSLSPGCYRFTVDDSDCDGLSFMNITEGTLRFYDADGVAIIFNLPNSGNFGCGYTKYFVVPQQEYVGVSKNSLNANAIGIYPNPANNSVRLKFNLNNSQNVTYKLMDISGRIVQQKNLSKVSSSSNETIDLSNVESGVYMISIQLEDNSVITKKLVIQK